MRKSAIFTMMILVIIINGCEKNSLKGDLAETSIKLVPVESARTIAVNFNANTFFNSANSGNHSGFTSTLTGNNEIKDYSAVNDHSGVPAFYIFNFKSGGFIFVSAEYQMRPVLAFMENGEFNKENVPVGFLLWAVKTINNIELVRKGLYDNSIIAKSAWQLFDKQNTSANTSEALKLAPPDPPNFCQSNPDYSTSTISTVGPLLATKWGQECGFNNTLPSYSCTDCSVQPATGCVATSTAQVIRFYHPTNSFAYNYTSMPATTGNSEVQRLMADVGTKVGMSYGCVASGGSSADGGNVPGALKTYFGFTTANRSSMNSGSYSHVESNVNSGWPVLLEGCATRTDQFLGLGWFYKYSNCHEWVCDGAQEITNSFCYNGGLMSETYLYFHMNWGWHEYFTNPPYTNTDYSGWFGFDNWGPVNGGETFQYANSMTTEIHP